MKINEAEQVLGITKANIRFYEKEGLLTPGRTESGYRDYSEADIERLKQIMILRKLGIPVQKIADILDGSLTLQEAIDENIRLLQNELDRLNGSLALCRQLQTEQSQELDTERYWQLIQEQETIGYQFQSLVDDYLKFSELNYDWLLWPLPGSALRSPRKVGGYILIFSAVTAFLKVRGGDNFFCSFFTQIIRIVTSLLFWTAVFVPLYFYSRKHPKAANIIMNIILIGIPAVALILVVLLMAIPFLS